MPSETSLADVQKLLLSHGWTLERIRGSHHTFAKVGETPIVIPVHRRRVKHAYVRLIRKRLGLQA